MSLVCVALHFLFPMLCFAFWSMQYIINQYRFTLGFLLFCGTQLRRGNTNSVLSSVNIYITFFSFKFLLHEPEFFMFQYEVLKSIKLYSNYLQNSFQCHLKSFGNFMVINLDIHAFRILLSLINDFNFNKYIRPFFNFFYWRVSVDRRKASLYAFSFLSTRFKAK